jgi:hypothetical protein
VVILPVAVIEPVETVLQDHTATLLNNGKVLIAGGGLPNSSSKAELYGPVAAVPRLCSFSLTDDGQGQGAILHAGTGQVASSDNPAVVGEVV